MSCFGQKLRWLTSWLKGAALTASCRDERDERKQTSGSIVRPSNDVETGVSIMLREEHGGYPTYWPCDVRCTGDVTLIRALLRNLRTCLVMQREKAQAEKPRGRKYRCTSQGRTAP
jgi:hypothetical protein